MPVPNTYMWIGGANQPVTIAGDWSPTGIPNSGDTAIVNSGTPLLQDIGLSDNLLVLGGTAGMSLTNDTTLPSTSGLDVMTTLNATGTNTVAMSGIISSAGTIEAISPDAALSIAIGPSGTIGGTLINIGTILVGSGDSLSVLTLGSTGLFQPGTLLVNGGTATIAARIGSAGGFLISGGGTLEINQLLSGGAPLGPIYFSGTNDVLKLDDIAALGTLNLSGLDTGDVLDLGTVSIYSAQLDWNDRFGGSEQLTVYSDATTVALTALITPAAGRVFSSGSLTLSGSSGTAGNVQITQGAGGDTTLTFLGTSTWQWDDVGKSFTLLSGPGNSRGSPGANDTVLVPTGTVSSSNSPQLTGNIVYVGSATGLFDNTSSTTFASAYFDPTTQFISQTKGANTVLKLGGEFVNFGTILADAQGGTFALTGSRIITSGTTLAGTFINEGTIQADIGDVMTITAGTSAIVGNAGSVIADGGTIIVNAQSGGSYGNYLGLWAAENGGVVDLQTVVQNGAFYFLGGGGTLKIEQGGNFGGRILGLGLNGTIDVAAANVGSVVVGNNGSVTLWGASGSIATMSVAGNLNTGTFTLTGGAGSAGSLNVTTNGTDTFITSALIPDVYTGGSGSWGTTGQWSTSALPDSGTTSVFSAGSGNRIVTVDASATAYGLNLEDPSVQISVGAPLTITRAINQIGGTLAVQSLGTVLAAQLRQAGDSRSIDVVINNGGLVVLTGNANNNPNNGTIGAVLTGALTVTGGTLDAAGMTAPGAGSTGGYISVNQNGGSADGVITVANVQSGGKVYDTFSIIESGAAGYGAVIVDGTGSIWNDVGDASDPITRGYMVVGQDSGSFFPVAGNGGLTIQNSAIVTEQNYAIIGQNTGGSGFVTVSSGGKWNIGTGTGGIGFLQLGRSSGSFGSLTINAGGTVAIGSGGTIVNAGSAVGTTTTVVAGYALDVGASGGGNGQVVVSGAGAVLTGQNQMRIGDSGSGTLTVSNGGVVRAVGSNLDLGGSNTTKNGGTGRVNVTSGGSIQVGGSLVVWQGSTLTMDAASAIDVGNSGSFNNGTLKVEGANVLQGSGLVIAPTIVDSGSIVALSGGTLEINGAIFGTGAVVLNSNATLRLDQSVGNALSGISFNSGGGETLILNSPGASFAAPILALGTTDRIEFGNGMTVTAANMVNGNTLELNFHGSIGGAGTYDLTNVTLAAGFAPVFGVGTDGSNGLTAVQFIGCFVSGTHVLTDRGEVAVEDLCVGDRVPTVLGSESAPVVWIGQRHIDCTRHPRPERVWPVRVAANAFGPGRPRRDLWLSPDHAVYVNDVLIPVQHLINGTTICQVRVPDVTYWHVELPQHDVVLAEGLPAESYLDANDRAHFANGGGAITLFPDFVARTWEMEGCAPLVVLGPELAAVRALVAAQAGQALAA